MVEARTYSDLYKNGFRGQVGLGYGIGTKAELFIRGTYYKMSPENVQVGTVAGLPLFGEWSDYKEWGGDVGVRYFFNRESKAKPYLASSLGFRSLSENPVTFRVPAAGVTLANVPFYDQSTVFQACLSSESPGAGRGFHLAVLGARWRGAPSRPCFGVREGRSENSVFA